MSPINDNTLVNLVKEAKGGSLLSLKKLLVYSEKIAFATLNCMLSDSKEDVSDIVQEILVKVSDNIVSLKDETLFKPWLNKIIIRNYYDWIRKHKKNKSLLLKDDILDISEANFLCDLKQSPQTDVIRSELNKVIKASVSMLKKPYREAILMREFNGMSYDDIAKLTKTNVGTVKSRIARARRQLKEYLAPYLEMGNKKC